MKSYLSKCRPALGLCLAVMVFFVSATLPTIAAEKNLPAGTTAHTEIIEVSDSAPVIVSSIWNNSTITVVQAAGETGEFRCALGTSTVDLDLPLVSNTSVSFRSGGFMTLQANSGTVKLAVYHVTGTTNTGASSSSGSSGGSVALDSETIGLIDALQSIDTNVQAMPAEIARQKVSLTANTAQDLSSTLTGDRLYIEITTMDASDEFWVDFDTPAVVGECRRAVDSINIKLPKDTVISVIASRSIDLFVLEAGK